MSERVRHIRALLAQGEPLPPASAGWLVQAFDRLLAGDEDPRAVLELDVASRKRERDKLLRQAAAELPGTAWQRATAMHAQVRRYRSGRAAAPWVSQAARAAPLPDTAERLRQILVQN